MKKYVSALLAVLIAAGCSNAAAPAVSDGSGEEKKEEATAEAEKTVPFEGFSVMSPSGAPAISLLPIMKEGKNQVDIVEDATVVQAAMVNPDASYDVILAPTNLGVKLALQGASSYKLLAVDTWGNLFIVGSDEADLEDPEKTVAVFGEQAVPGLVFKKTYADIKANVNYGFASAQDTMAALLGGTADAALIAEPAATAAIAKGKENGLDLKIISDVQNEWGNGFPMASIFVKESTYEENKEAYATMLKMMADYNTAVTLDDPDAVAADIEEIGFEKFGVPSAQIIGKTYPHLNIHITEASEVKDEIAEFLAIFDIKDIEDAFVK